VSDAILSNESLELFTADCRAIISDYLLRNSMGKENSFQLLDGLLCCYLSHYFNIHPLGVDINNHQIHVSHEGTCKVKM